MRQRRQARTCEVREASPGEMQVGALVSLCFRESHSGQEDGQKPRAAAQSQTNMGFPQEAQGTAAAGGRSDPEEDPEGPSSWG